MTGAVVPFALFAVLSDLTKHKTLTLFGFAMAGSLAWLASGTAPAAAIAIWISSGWHLYVTFLVHAGVLVGIMLGAYILKRRALVRLDWPACISLMDMQRGGTLHLFSRGWQVEPLPSGFAGISVYACRKQKLRMFAIFFQGNILFSRLVRNLATVPGLVVRNVVLIARDRPNANLYTAAAAAGFRVIHYTELPEVDALCQEVEEQRLAQIRNRAALAVRV